MRVSLLYGRFYSLTASIVMCILSCDLSKHLNLLIYTAGYVPLGQDPSASSTDDESSEDEEQAAPEDRSNVKVSDNDMMHTLYINPLYYISIECIEAYKFWNVYVCDVYCFSTVFYRFSAAHVNNAPVKLFITKKTCWS